MALWLSACVSASDRLGVARGEQERADLVDEALAHPPLPELPADCRRTEPSGVRVGDRLDVALLKSERARGAANARVVRCAGFYDEVRGHE